MLVLCEVRVDANDEDAVIRTEEPEWRRYIFNVDKVTSAIEIDVEGDPAVCVDFDNGQTLILNMSFDAMMMILQQRCTVWRKEEHSDN